MKTDLLEILSLVMPELGRLTRTMISDKVVSKEERRQAIKNLCSLVSQDCTTLYRPGEIPINGVCPVKGCGAKMIKYNYDVSRIRISLTVAVYVNLNEVHISTTAVAKSWRVPSSDCKRN